MYRVLTFIFLLCLLSTFMTAQTPRSAPQPAPRSSYDPAPRSPSSSHREGFLDFTLKRINPADTDYGREIEEERRTFILATLENTYWWVSLASVSMLAILFLNWLRLHHERNRREIVAAAFLTWYHNELVTSRQTALDAIEKHRQLQHFIDSQPEPKPAPRLPAASTASARKAMPAAPLVAAQEWQTISAPEAHDLHTELNTLRQTVKAREQQVARLQQQLQGERQKNHPGKAAEAAPSPAEKN